MGASGEIANFVVIVLVMHVITGYAWNKTAKRDPKEYESPEFDDLSIRAIQANVGQTVLLPCTVRNLGDKVVSWIRTKDLHILTTSTQTFSADNRFESVHSITNNFWGLRIRGVRTSDTGRYECQVNSDPKMSLGINLSVTGHNWSSFANIKGPPEMNIVRGSSVSLTCEITPVLQRPVLYPNQPIYWLHDGRPISFDSQKRSISAEADYRSRNSISRLRIGDASPEDQGLYTCTQASAKPHSARLFIVETEQQHQQQSEAMQRDAPHSGCTKGRISEIVLYGLNPIVIRLIVGYFVPVWK